MFKLAAQKKFDLHKDELMNFRMYIDMDFLQFTIFNMQMEKDEAVKWKKRLKINSMEMKSTLAHIG